MPIRVVPPFVCIRCSHEHSVPIAMEGTESAPRCRKCDSFQPYVESAYPRPLVSKSGHPSSMFATTNSMHPHTFHGSRPPPAFRHMGQSQHFAQYSNPGFGAPSGIHPRAGPPMLPSQIVQRPLISKRHGLRYPPGLEPPSLSSLTHPTQPSSSQAPPPHQPQPSLSLDLLLPLSPSSHPLPQPEEQSQAATMQGTAISFNPTASIFVPQSAPASQNQTSFPSNQQSDNPQQPTQTSTPTPTISLSLDTGTIEQSPKETTTQGTSPGGESPPNHQPTTGQNIVQTEPSAVETGSLSLPAAPPPPLSSPPPPSPPLPSPPLPSQSSDPISPSQLTQSSESSSPSPLAQALEAINPVLDVARFELANRSGQTQEEALAKYRQTVLHVAATAAMDIIYASGQGPITIPGHGEFLHPPSGCPDAPNFCLCLVIRNILESGYPGQIAIGGTSGVQVIAQGHQNNTSAAEAHGPEPEPGPEPAAPEPGNPEVTEVVVDQQALDLEEEKRQARLPPKFRTKKNGGTPSPTAIVLPVIPPRDPVDEVRKRWAKVKGFHDLAGMATLGIPYGSSPKDNE